MSKSEIIAQIWNVAEIKSASVEKKVIFTRMSKQTKDVLERAKNASDTREHAIIAIAILTGIQFEL